MNRQAAIVPTVPATKTVKIGEWPETRTWEDNLGFILAQNNSFAFLLSLFVTYVFMCEGRSMEVQRQLSGATFPSLPGLN